MRNFEKRFFFCRCTHVGVMSPPPGGRRDEDVSPESSPEPLPPGMEPETMSPAPLPPGEGQFFSLHPNFLFLLVR